MRRYTLHLPDQQLNWLRKRSQETGLSVSELIRAAIEKYKEEKTPSITLSNMTQEEWDEAMHQRTDQDAFSSVKIVVKDQP